MAIAVGRNAYVTDERVCGNPVIPDRRLISWFSAWFERQNLHDKPCRNGIVYGNRSTLVCRQTPARCASRIPLAYHLSVPDLSAYATKMRDSLFLANLTVPLEPMFKPKNWLIFNTRWMPCELPVDSGRPSRWHKRSRLDRTANLKSDSTNPVTVINHNVAVSPLPISCLMRRGGEAVPSTPGDISLAIGDGARRMTYAELAAVRGISVTSARRLVLRHRWPRQIGNDGIVRVTVPLTALIKADPSEGHDATTDATTESAKRPEAVGFRDAVTSAPLSHPTDHPTVSADPASDPMTVTLTRALDALREQMALANERADRAEQLLADERRHVEELRAMLANAMAAERMLADKDATITHLRRQIENLMKLLIDRQPWWKRWFRV